MSLSALCCIFNAPLLTFTGHFACHVPKTHPGIALFLWHAPLLARSIFKRLMSQKEVKNKLDADSPTWSTCRLAAQLSVVTTLGKMGSQNYLLPAANGKCCFVAFVWSAGSLLFQVWLLSSRLSAQKNPLTGSWGLAHTVCVSLCYLSVCLAGLKKG